METARFLSASGLESFLAASQAPNAPQFRGSDQWSLLLTLECALKRIATVRAQIRSGAGIAR